MVSCTPVPASPLHRLTWAKVRKELSADGKHKHIEGVYTADGTH